ncbi:MAG: FecR domain-containing protein [Burkholderiales bacterium]|nr:FecR domain-containing protein [Burkholderiales bacterium]
MLQRRKLASLLVLAGVVSAGPAFGQSGTFTFVTGDVSVQRRDGQRVPVTRGAPVNSGDTIVSGDKGMAQLTMVDQAKLSVRPNTQFQIEQYADRPDSDQGALLNLVRGTLRTFTGLIAARTRDRFLMKTRVATVGIRGSGNVLFAGTADDCDPAKVGVGKSCDITVNHTIEGSHAITFGDFSGPGLPAQQGGAQTLVTGPGQTVLVTGRGDVRYIPTPQFIAAAATNPVGEVKEGGAVESSGETRNFAPSDSSSSLTSQGTQGFTPVGNNGLGFTFLDSAVAVDPLGLQDIVFVGGATLAGQALPADILYEGTATRGYTAYSGTQTGLAPRIVGGTSASNNSYQNGGLAMTAGRYSDARLRYYDTDPSFAVPGSIHWIQANSGYPAYLADVLTGTATYTSVLSTPPTSQTNVVGSLGATTIDVNFTNRTLSTSMSVSMPAAGGGSGNSWQVTATGVPFALNSFYATTFDLLRIRNASGGSSLTNPSIAGGIEGSFVGSDLSGIIMGYTISDFSSANPANFYTVNGVVGLHGPAQDVTTPYLDGLISDPAGTLAGGLVRNYAVTNRPDEVTADAQGRVTAFTAPYGGQPGGHQQYSIGTASVAQFGLDAATGLVWGRWAGGTATVVANGNQSSLNLNSNSLHYVFSGAQSAPVTLPLTGTATYELVGSTAPTNSFGSVGTLNSATLAADFATRTVDASVNLTIAGQNIVGVANDIPIYRDQYFSAFRGTAPGGLPVPQLLNITCTPGCSNPTGSIDGFFAGRNAIGAGMMYNLNGASGATAFRRPGT